MNPHLQNDPNQYKDDNTPMAHMADPRFHSIKFQNNQYDQNSKKLPRLRRQLPRRRRFQGVSITSSQGHLNSFFDRQVSFFIYFILQNFIL